MSSLLNSKAVKRPLLAGLALPLVLLSGLAFADGDGVWKSGENVYQKICGHCHEAKVGPVITGRQLPPEYITAVVRNGFRAMPAFPASFIDDKALRTGHTLYAEAAMLWTETASLIAKAGKTLDTAYLDQAGDALEDLSRIEAEAMRAISTCG